MDAQPLTVLRDFRRNHRPRLTQAAFAQMVSVTRETVARWELGVRKIDEEKLPVVAEVTKIPRDQLRSDLAALMSIEVAQ